MDPEVWKDDYHTYQDPNSNSLLPTRQNLQKVVHIAYSPKQKYSTAQPWQSPSLQAILAEFWSPLWTNCQ